MRWYLNVLVCYVALVMGVPSFALSAETDTETPELLSIDSVYQRAMKTLGDGDVSRAIQELEKLVVRNHAQSMYALARIKVEFFKETEEYLSAIRLLEKSTKLGHRKSVILRCELLLLSEYIERDNDKQKSCLNDARDLGVDEVGYIVWLSDLKKFDPKRIPNKSYQKLKLAAEKNFMPAVVELVRIHAFRDFGRFDTKKKFYWMQRAAELGDPLFQYKVAHEYLSGEIVDKDPVKYNYWIEKYKRNKSGDK